MKHGPDRPIASRSASVNARKADRVVERVIIQRAPAELYAMWRDFSQLPRFMSDLESVTDRGDGVYHWVARVPLGQYREWDARIVNDIPNELIAWRTVDESDVSHAGSVHFRSAGANATELEVIIEYEPPGGMLGSMLARASGMVNQDPGSRLRSDLERFKDSVEGGR